MNKSRIPIEERFFNKVKKTKACWLWTGATASGYGTIGRGGKGQPMVGAHRISWELVNGPIPEGLCILHRCDVKLCVNPDHLFLGTHAENVMDKVNKKRHGYGEKNPNSFLTNVSVLKIREIASMGVPQTKIAKKFKTTTATISRVVSRKIWRHL
jgi:hypothetical protein